MIGQRFKLRFHEPFTLDKFIFTGGVFTEYIDEPVGMDSVPFTLKEKSKGYGRDVFFGGDNQNEFSFFERLNHQVDNILYFVERYGWNGKIQLLSEFEGVETLVGDFSMQHIEDLGLGELKVRIVQDSDEARLKRMSEINVNLLEDGALNESINPEDRLTNKVELIRTLIKSKPTNVLSSWKPTDHVAFTGTVTGFRTNYQNAFTSIQDSDISNTLSFIDRTLVTNRSAIGLPRGLENMRLIEAVDNVTNIKIVVSDFRLSYYIAETASIGDFTPSIIYSIGTDDNISQISNSAIGLPYTLEFKGIENVDRFNGTLTGNAKKYDLVFDRLEFNIDSIPRGFSLYVVFDLKRLFNYVEWYQDHGLLQVVATSTAYNTVSPAIRLRDAVVKTVGSISGLETNFPEADARSHLYNQMIFNGNLLRNITDRSFNLSFDKIVKWIPEINHDYEVHNETVNFLHYSEFYRSVEMEHYTSVRFDSYKRVMSQRHAINQFNYKYKKFHSQKEEEVFDSFDIVHGEAQCLLANEYVENKKEINVEFVRDALMIDEQRKKAFDLSNRTSTQDDDTIYIIDTVRTSGVAVEFTETDTLEHKVDLNSGDLRVSNNRNLDWSLLGLKKGDRFDIENDPNSGFYNINSIEANVLHLSFARRLTSNRNDGVRLTRFTYYVTDVDYMTRSDEGFDDISGLVTATGFSNLAFTKKRNIINYWSEYLATCNLFSESPIKFTNYTNNGELRLTYNNLTTVEREDFTPENPLIRPFEHTIILIMTFDEFMSLIQKIKTERGFIRVNDENGHPLRLFPKELNFLNKGDCGELELTGYEKYGDGSIDIVNGGRINYILVNGETRVDTLTFTEEGRKVSIRDGQGTLLYMPVFWNRITFNGSFAENQRQLRTWLQTLS